MGLLPGGGFGGLSGLFDDGSAEARKRQEEQLRYIQGLFDDPTSMNPGSLFGQLNLGYAQGAPYLQQALQATKEGNQKALGALGGAGAQAYSSIQQQARQAASSARQRAASSGLYSTTAPVERGTQQTASNAIGQLGSSLGVMFAGQHMAGASATSNALSNLANYYRSKGQASAGLGQNYASLLSSYQYQPGQSMFQQLSPLLGYTLGGILK